MRDTSSLPVKLAFAAQHRLCLLEAAKCNPHQKLCWWTIYCTIHGANFSKKIKVQLLGKENKRSIVRSKIADSIQQPYIPLFSFQSWPRLAKQIAHRARRTKLLL